MNRRATELNIGIMNKNELLENILNFDKRIKAY